MSSSRQWNPGDEFILLGVRRLLKAALDAPINYVLWNRNPDLFIDRWRDAAFRPDFLTNSAREPALDRVDLVVLAGTPEWSGRPVERIFREMLRYPSVPLLALGIGGAGPGFRFSDLEREVFGRENSLVVCRNPVLAGEIDEQLGREKARTLPCPALFCAPSMPPRSAESFEQVPPAVTVQSDGVENQSAPAGFVAQLIDHLDHDPGAADLRLVSHYVDEFLRFSRLKPEAYHFYSYEPLDYLTFYREEIRALLASRLHGAIAGLSCGTPSCVVDFGSDRVNDAARPFGDLLPRLAFDDALEWLRAQTPETAAGLSRAAVAFKEEAFMNYAGLIEGFLGHLSRRARPIAGVVS